MDLKYLFSFPFLYFCKCFELHKNEVSVPCAIFLSCLESLELWVTGSEGGEAGEPVSYTRMSAPFPYCHQRPHHCHCYCLCLLSKNQLVQCQKLHMEAGGPCFPQIWAASVRLPLQYTGSLKDLVSRLLSSFVFC